MPREASLSTTWVIALVYALEARGLDLRELWQRSALDPACVREPNGRLPVSAVQRLWREAVAMTGDPCLGLRVAQYVQPTTFLSLGNAILSSETLEDAMRRAVRFSRVVSDAVHIECRDTCDGLLQSWRFPRHPEVLPQAIDLHMAATLKMARLMTGTQVTLARLWRRHRPAPEVVAEYEAFFACPMEFGAEHDAFLVPHALARQRLPMANPALALESDAAVQSYLARFDGSSFADRTREAILQQLPSGEPQRATVARSLGLSEKTLQRRLASENTSFAHLVNEARVELARRYVLDPGLRLGDIAFRLGFAEQSGFTRAFKRWTGQSPAEFREAYKRAAEPDAREASSR